MWICSASPVGGFACPYLSQRALGSVDGELTAALSVLHCAVSRIPWTLQVLLLVALQSCRGLQHTTDTRSPQISILLNRIEQQFWLPEDMPRFRLLSSLQGLSQVFSQMPLRKIPQLTRVGMSMKHSDLPVFN